MDNNEIFDNDDKIINIDTDEYISQGNVLFKIFIGSIPSFIDILIKDLEKLNLKDGETFDITIDFNEYISIINSKFIILANYLNKVGYDCKIQIKSKYPKTEVKLMQINKELIQYLIDAKFLIYCDFNSNLGHA